MIPDNIKQEFFEGNSYFAIDPSNQIEMQFIKNQFNADYNHFLSKLIEGKLSTIKKISKYPNIVYSNGLCFTNTKTGRKYLGKISSYMYQLPLQILIKNILNECRS